ncbi:MAG: hypothetical protein WKF91_20305 [Segetibacter sp.]
MDEEVLQTVLTKLLQEFKEVKQQQGETAKALFELKNKVAGFEQKLTDVRIVPPAINVQPITTAIDNGLDKIKSTIEAQPKSITKQFRVLLFPEYNAMEYYKVVLERVLFWMLMFLIVTYLYLLCKQFIRGC